MKVIKFLFLTLGLSVSFVISGVCHSNNQSVVENAMLKATKFMVEEVSTNGGFVGSYNEDLSRRWGELEAYESQIWVQNPGTVSMGNLFLNAYHATKNEYYYHAAEKAADALIWGQHETGGWHYFIDFAGDQSLREWYRTIGKNAWGFEEHNQYYGNATFDDLTTAEAAKFLLRIYLEKMDSKFKPALDKAINFVLKAQYPLGGWPQRYPLMDNHPRGDKLDYTSFYTFNDDVISANINFLIQCYTTLNEARLLNSIYRAMNFYLITQQAMPQAGWSKQHDFDLKPAHARSYEPAALYPDFTYTNAELLMRFYELTGDRKFLARIPDAIEFLKSVSEVNADETLSFPIFIEVGTNKPLYAHRKGSNVNNGYYWVDYNPESVIQHYRGRKIDIQKLKKEYSRLNELTPEEASKGSPLFFNQFSNSNRLKDYLKRSESTSEIITQSDIDSIIKSLDSRGRWLEKHPAYSFPYSISDTGEESNTARRSDESGTTIVDPSDKKYISVRTYTTNMQVFIDYLAQDN